MTRRNAVAGAAVAAVLAGSQAGTAHAAKIDVVCAGQAKVTYSPGLTLTPKDVTATVSSTYAPCASSSRPRVASGTANYSIPLSRRSCLETLSPGRAAFKIAWNTGKSSTFSFSRTITAVGGSTVVTLSGTISDGLYAGARAVQTLTYPTLDTLSCLSATGVTKETGLITLTITSR